MNQFRTIVRPISSNYKIGLENSVFTLGSCFADAIGQRLQQSKINTRVNPFGVTYNPISIHKLLHYTLTGNQPPGHSYLNRDEVHFNFDFHSSVCWSDQAGLQNRIESMLADSNNFLKSATHLLLTYGTAWVYTRRETQEPVNNCHKLPAFNFAKSLCTEHEIVSSFKALYMLIKNFNPGLKIILTLSPVRHIKDTLQLNSVSKAILRSSCHTLATTFPDVEYFSAYEMMIDDLRDYRFYKPDMLHPSEVAEDYIWENFMSTYFTAETAQLIQRWQTLKNSMQHKPFHPHSKSHQQFLRQTLAKLQELKTVINVDAEIAAIEQQLNP